MIEWIIENKEWFLDGLGVFALGLLVSFLVWMINKKETSSKSGINQSVGDNSKAQNITFTNITQTANEKSKDKEE